MNRKEFTLIEIIAIIALLGIISAISVVSIQDVIMKRKTENCDVLDNNYYIQIAKGR